MHTQVSRSRLPNLRAIALPALVLLWSFSILFPFAAAQAGLPASTQPDPPIKLDEPKPADKDEKVTPWPAADLAPEVQRLLDADYLKDDERADLRVRHGAWEEADLTSPRRRAAAALIRGDYADGSFNDPGAAIEDRAEAALRRGEPDKAVELLTTVKSFRAQRVLAEALLDVGKFDDAIAVLSSAAKSAADEGETAPTTGDELAEAVRCMLLLTRWLAPDSPDRVSHQQMLNLLAKARDDMDRLSWRAPLVEAMLLYERDKYGEVSAAATSVL